MTTYQLSAREREILLLATSAVASATKAVAALQASSSHNSRPPEPKSLSPDLKTLLAKHDLTELAEKGALTLAEVDKSLEAAGVSGHAALTAKLKLMSAGLLPAGVK